MAIAVLILAYFYALRTWERPSTPQVGNPVSLGQSLTDAILIYPNWDAYEYQLQRDTFIVPGGTAALFLQEFPDDSVLVEIAEGDHRGKRGITMKRHLVWRTPKP